MKALSCFPPDAVPPRFFHLQDIEDAAKGSPTFTESFKVLWRRRERWPNLIIAVVLGTF